MAKLTHLPPEILTQCASYLIIIEDIHAFILINRASFRVGVEFLWRSPKLTLRNIYDLLHSKTPLCAPYMSYIRTLRVPAQYERKFTARAQTRLKNGYDLIACCPRLESLDVSNCRRLGSYLETISAKGPLLTVKRLMIRSASLSVHQFETIADIWPNLHSLELRRAKKAHNDWAYHFARLVDLLKNLDTVSIVYDYEVDIESIVYDLQVLSNCPNLKKLSFQNLTHRINCQPNVALSLSRLINRIPSLDVLQLDSRWYFPCTFKYSKTMTSGEPETLNFCWDGRDAVEGLAHAIAHYWEDFT